MLPRELRVWASHGDYVARAAAGFAVVATSAERAGGRHGATGRGRRFGLLFHPEVAHTERGTDILRNFAFGVCGCTRRLDDGVVHRRGDRARFASRWATAASSAP